MSYAIWRSLSQVGQVARGCVQEGGSGMMGIKVCVSLVHFPRTYNVRVHHVVQSLMPDPVLTAHE